MSIRLAVAIAAVACSSLIDMPQRYVARRAAARPIIDGRLNDPAWRDAAWTDRFVDIEGDAKPRPRFDTRVKMLWDDEYFYVGADLQEPHVWGTLTAHDSVIFHDPDFEVFIDPNGDGLEYYEFEINALGTGWDLFLPKPYKQGGKASNAWEIPGLKPAVFVDGTLNDARDRDRGWSVELAFPWSVLGEFAHRPSPPAPGDEWRINFSRVEWPIEITGRAYRKVPTGREDNWVWSPQGVVNMHVPEKWGYVRFQK
jgi:cellulose/xylan binding protein with CBM9 domain